MPSFTATLSRHIIYARCYALRSHAVISIPPPYRQLAAAIAISIRRGRSALFLNCSVVFHFFSNYYAQPVRSAHAINTIGVIEAVDDVHNLCSRLIVCATCVTCTSWQPAINTNRTSIAACFTVH
jgi:hypothetical protein